MEAKFIRFASSAIKYPIKFYIIIFNDQIDHFLI
jgi:hypothetical protein